MGGRRGQLTTPTATGLRTFPWLCWWEEHNPGHGPYQEQSYPASGWCPRPNVPLAKQPGQLLLAMTCPSPPSAPPQVPVHTLALMAPITWEPNAPSSNEFTLLPPRRWGTNAQREA